MTTDNPRDKWMQTPSSGKCHPCSCHIDPPCNGCVDCVHIDYPDCPNDCQECEVPHVY